MKNSQYFTSIELLERWQIKSFDLLEIIKEEELKFKMPDSLANPKLIFLVEDLGIADIEGGELIFHIKEIKNYEEEHPQYKPQTAPYISSQGEIPPYLDDKNKYFSKELSIAIETWLAIYGPGATIDSKKAHRQQITEYLEKKYPELFSSNLAVDRIVTIVNFNKKGGSTKTP